MSTGQTVGLVILAAMTAPLLYLIPVVRDLRRAPTHRRQRIDPAVLALPCYDAAAAILADELMPEIDAALEGEG